MTINGVRRTAEVEDRTLLVTALRDHFNLTGTHIGCDTAQCGACSVRLNGKVIKSCSIFAMQAEDCELESIEGVAPDDRTLHPMQVAFTQTLGLQCGYCTPGMVMLALDLVHENPDPDRETVVRSLSGNLCRCTGYEGIVSAILLGAKMMREQKEG